MAGSPGPVLNIMVVGFHHKKGCQVEFCHPELPELPKAWRHLPALALPDGSHNFLSDTVYFHLPSADGDHGTDNTDTTDGDERSTVFGVSCFRQIPVERVARRTSDMTRSSVQKSVCVVSREPFFGRLAVKLELVAEAWFRRADFGSTSLLRDAYAHLNACPTLAERPLEGLSAVGLVDTWRHKAVLLFKLLLLQKRVVFHGSPAGPVSACLLTALSLFPGCVERGLKGSAYVTPSGATSPSAPLGPPDDETGEAAETVAEPRSRDGCASLDDAGRDADPPTAAPSPSLVRDMSVDGLTNLVASVELDGCGLPLRLFSDGHLCLPYLSLQYMDLLSDPGVAGFVAGASNVLFRQKRQLWDALVDVAECRVETADPELRRRLQLSTEDLRFADHLVRHASLRGEDWTRDQFSGYLLCLLRTCASPDAVREADHFEPAFVAAFRATRAFAAWEADAAARADDVFLNVPPGHPFAGQLSVADVRLRLAHTMTSTEGGRKMTAAVVNTGRAVASTSRVVGGALHQARGALSVWWSAFSAPPPPSDSDRVAYARDGDEAFVTFNDSNGAPNAVE